MSEGCSMLDLAMMLEAKANEAFGLGDVATAAALFQAAALYRCADTLQDISQNMPEPPP